MRTNIEIDEDLLHHAMEVSESATKRAAVEAALRLTVQLNKQEEIRSLFGKIQWEGDLAAMRESRVLAWEEECAGAEQQVPDRSGLESPTAQPLVSPGTGSW